MRKTQQHMDTPVNLTQSSAAPGQPSSVRRQVRGWARDLVIAMGLAMVIVIFLYQPVKVEGTSMAPLLNDQERIFINKFVYHFGPVARGDIVVFWYPKDPSKSFIKRVIALPGEVVEGRNGQVYINGQLLPEPYVRPEYADRTSFGPLRVPEGQYFLLGDHRSSSNDSRMFGPVEERFIYGKAVFAYWPVSRMGTIPAYATDGADD